MYAAAPHILCDHPLVKADGRVEIIDARIDRLGKRPFQSCSAIVPVPFISIVTRSFVQPLRRACPLRQRSRAATSPKVRALACREDIPSSKTGRGAVHLENGAMYFTNRSGFSACSGIPGLPKAPPLGELASEARLRGQARLPIRFILLSRKIRS